MQVNAGQRLEIGVDPNYLYEVKCTFPDRSTKNGYVDGSIPAIVNIQPRNAGIYTITAKDGKGCRAETKITVKVNGAALVPEGATTH